MVTASISYNLHQLYLSKASSLLSKQLPTSSCLNLFWCHLFYTFNPSHLGHHLFDDEQVQAVLGLKLVSNILEQASQLYGVFLVDCTAEGGQGSQPHGDAGSICLGPGTPRVIQRLNNAEAEHIKGQVGEVLERIYYRTDQIIIDLDLGEDVGEEQPRGAVAQLAQLPASWLHILFRHSLQQCVMTVLHCG